MERVIGIDLGTTNSCVAIVEGGVPLVLPGPSGQRGFPAVLAIDENGLPVLQPQWNRAPDRQFTTRVLEEAARITHELPP